jgi:hypothetical protein
MARFKARLTADPAGGWIAAAVELPNCWSRGRDRDEALAKLRDEIRYRIEYCPCTGVDDEFVQVDVSEVARSVEGAAVQAPAAARAAPERAPRDGVAPAVWRGVAGCPGGPRPASPAGEGTPAARRRRSRWSD